jgi:hypothetical protein
VNLATAPGTPKNVQIHATAPPGLSGINTTTLTWNACPEPNLAGYEAVTRETTSPDWTDAVDVGNGTTVTLDISKDKCAIRPARRGPGRPSQPSGLPAGGDLLAGC